MVDLIADKTKIPGTLCRRRRLPIFGQGTPGWRTAAAALRRVPACVFPAATHSARPCACRVGIGVRRQRRGKSLQLCD